MRAGLILLVVSAAAAQTPARVSTPVEGRQFLKKNCLGCHSGKTPAGEFDAAKLLSNSSLRAHSELWAKSASRVHEGAMPPKSTLPLDQRESFDRWVQETLRAEVCAVGVAPGPAPLRRLNRFQYTNTLRDLLNLHVDTGAGLPPDGAGGEGFDNAAETLFLSPIHAEKYLEAAKSALDFASKDARARAKFLIATPGEGIVPEQAARTIFENFLPRAFRRPLEPADFEFYMGLFSTAMQRGDSFEDAVLYSLRAALISPQFLFRIEPRNATGKLQLIDDYSLATRLSYFLWASAPDSLLLALAEERKLSDPEVLKGQVARMLRNKRSFDFARSFVEQWLRVRDLGEALKPDLELYPQWKDSELQGDIKLQPVLFFKEMLASDLPVLDLLDSKWTIATRKLQRLWGTSIKPARPDNQSQPQRIELPEGTNRGGLLGMPAVLAISSHPHRSSPVLRGKWLLDAVLGTPPPPPPPGVPALEDVKDVEKSATLRERLARHRADAACASCHDRIDPLGFALENYDVLGRWRTEDAGKPIDARGELPDGTSFDGPAELKSALMAKKDLFVRNLTKKVLGYALGRGLTLEDMCTVDNIVAEVERNNYSSHALINAVVMSVPFRYQAPAAAPLRQSQSRPSNPHAEVDRSATQARRTGDWQSPRRLPLRDQPAPQRITQRTSIQEKNP